MTYLQIVNAVLRRLREDEVTSYNETDYSSLISDFVNEAKREVEDAWNWTSLKDTKTITCIASTQEYTITDAGNRYRILQAVNDTQDTVMRIAPYDWIQRQTLLGTSTEASPYYYSIVGQTGGDPDITVYPIPDTADSLKFNMIIPQADLADSSTVLTIPEWPVILGAYAKAISERGEDGSTQYAEVVNDYNKAMADAIGLDAVHVPHETVWKVC